MRVRSSQEPMLAEPASYSRNQCAVVCSGSVEFVVDMAKARIETSLDSISGPNATGTKGWVSNQVPRRQVYVHIIAGGARIAANNNQVERVCSRISQTGRQIRRQLALDRGRPAHRVRCGQVLLYRSH